MKPGFLWRGLSGSTAEFLQTWQLTFFGPKPFKAGENGIELDLRPATPGVTLIDETPHVGSDLRRSLPLRFSHFAAKSRTIFPGSDTVTRLTLPAGLPDEIRRGAQSQARAVDGMNEFARTEQGVNMKLGKALTRMAGIMMSVCMLAASDRTGGSDSRYRMVGL
ncbi:MAG: hypothetical protein ACLTSG_00780 [Lachnospiraceae bacterium]